MECRSIIPQLSGIASGADELPELRDLDKALNSMGNEEIQQYKALLEVIQPGTPYAALRLANEMTLFDVETRFADPAAYGRGVAEAGYDLDPDSPIFKHIDLQSLGEELLRDDGYISTRYGSVYRNAMAQQFLAGRDTVYSGDYYCGRTEGFPTVVCWDPDAQKVWMELNVGAADSELQAEYARCQSICND